MRCPVVGVGSGGAYIAAMIFNDRSSLLSHLRTRRSGKPRDMVAPGPTGAEIDAMIAIAARTPDHGKLAPWRFIVVPEDRRAAFGKLLRSAFVAGNPQATSAQLEACDRFAEEGAALIVVLSSPVDSHIPRWEQELSAGAATMNLLHAAHAMGYVASWLTGWAAYSDQVRDAFGGPDERIAGFVYFGSPGRPLDERPRPDLARVRTVWAS
ncbi:nitroreductase [Sphingomonas sp. 2R-10]|nr:nitroreductase [Sphingomonas sp. 2R-10]